MSRVAPENVGMVDIHAHIGTRTPPPCAEIYELLQKGCLHPKGGETTENGTQKGGRERWERWMVRASKKRREKRILYASLSASSVHTDHVWFCIIIL